MSGTPPVIIIGIDAAEIDVLDRLVAEGRLPNLARLRQQGRWGRLHALVRRRSSRNSNDPSSSVLRHLPSRCCRSRRPGPGHGGSQLLSLLGLERNADVNG